MHKIILSILNISSMKKQDSWEAQKESNWIPIKYGERRIKYGCQNNLDESIYINEKLKIAAEKVLSEDEHHIELII